MLVDIATLLFLDAFESVTQSSNGSKAIPIESRVHEWSPVTAFAILLGHRQAEEIAKTQRPRSRLWQNPMPPNPAYPIPSRGGCHTAALATELSYSLEASAECVVVPVGCVEHCWTFVAKLVSPKFVEEQKQILRLTTPELKNVRSPVRS